MNEEPEKMPKNSSAMVWIAIIAIVVVVGVVYFSRGGNQTTSPAVNPPSSPSTSDGSKSDAATPSANAPSVKTFDVSGKPFEFSVKEIRVKKGDTVKINFSSTQGMHDWVVDEFNARTKILQAGQSDSIMFVADKTGTFEYYCNLPTHRQQGMVGKLIVE